MAIPRPERPIQILSQQRNPQLPVSMSLQTLARIYTHWANFDRIEGRKTFGLEIVTCPLNSYEAGLNRARLRPISRVP